MYNLEYNFFFVFLFSNCKIHVKCKCAIECLVPIFMRLRDDTQNWSKAIGPYVEICYLIYDNNLHFIV